MNNPPLFFSFKDSFGAVVRHRNLVFSLFKKDTILRYRDFYLGMLWSIIQPLLMMCVYAFVFGSVFGHRWSEVSHTGLQRVTLFFSGLIYSYFFSECLNRAPQLILQQPNLAKKALFPLEILPWVSLASGFFHFICNLAVLLIFTGIAYNQAPWGAFFLPIILLPFMLYILGFSWYLAGLSVYFRDAEQVISPILTALLFLSPTFYPMASVPEAWRQAYYLNPLTWPILAGRELLLENRFIENFWPGWLIYSFIGLLIFQTGWRAFLKLKPGFADVL